MVDTSADDGIFSRKIVGLRGVETSGFFNIIYVLHAGHQRNFETKTVSLQFFQADIVHGESTSAVRAHSRFSMEMSRMTSTGISCVAFENSSSIGESPIEF